MSSTVVTISFEYKGAVRKVANPKFRTGRGGVSTVVGFEMEKDGVKTMTVKAYRIDRIEKVVG